MYVRSEIAAQQDISQVSVLKIVYLLHFCLPIPSSIVHTLLPSPQTAHRVLEYLHFVCQ